jgi:type VI protein secretion system component Hcp
MSTLVIADLPKKDDLSAEKMKEVVGGTTPTQHVAVHDFHFTRPIDKSSPTLFLG